MTLLIASICPQDLPTLRARAEEAWAGGAEAVEVRIDGFEDRPADLAEYLRAHPGRTWIVTCRSQAEGGYCPGHAAHRAARIAEASRLGMERVVGKAPATEAGGSTGALISVSTVAEALDVIG